MLSNFAPRPMQSDCKTNLAVQVISLYNFAYISQSKFAWKASTPMTHQHARRAWT